MNTRAIIEDESARDFLLRQIAAGKIRPPHEVGWELVSADAPDVNGEMYFNSRPPFALYVAISTARQWNNHMRRCGRPQDCVAPWRVDWFINLELFNDRAPEDWPVYTEMTVISAKDRAAATVHAQAWAWKKYQTFRSKGVHAEG